MGIEERVAGVTIVGGSEEPKVLYLEGVEKQLDVTIVGVSEEREVLHVEGTLAAGETTSKFVLSFPSRNGRTAKSFVVRVPPEAVTAYGECVWDRYRSSHPELNLPAEPDVAVVSRAL